MATVIETPISFGARAGEPIITLRISPQITAGTVAERARAVVDVAFDRDDGRDGRTEVVTIAIAADGDPVPSDSADVIVGVSQADVTTFVQVAAAIWSAAVARAEAPK